MTGWVVAGGARSSQDMRTEAIVSSPSSQARFLKMLAYSTGYQHLFWLFRTEFEEEKVFFI
jgi:hypothetical protein